jgi:signal transduction histidine kinase
MTSTASDPTDYSTLKGVDILIAEDSPTQAMKLLHVLEQQGCRATHAQNGRKALASLATHIPTLVITDVNMPEIDGFELCKRIKNDPKLKDVPVVLLTSLSSPQDIIRGLECGADNFVVKPYVADFLLSRLVTVLANRNLGLADDAHEIPIYFAGQRYVITSRRRQILNLLLSTYETALNTNDALIAAQEALKAAQQQLIEAEKIQSVGRLAAGVAHEVKNPLAIIEMGVDLLATKPDAETVEMLVGEMKESVKRANHVIAGLMEVSSADESGMKDADLSLLVDRVLAELEPAITRSKIEVSKDYAPSLPMCRVDTTKIEQVITNVITNAIQEMPDGGKLGISVSSKTLGAADVNFDAGDRSGFRFRVGDTAVIIEVRDTGGGIRPENLTKVFEPFFSTRPTGKGMGLGLTVARKFMELHGGRIAMANAGHGGAVATMVFKTA